MRPVRSGQGSLALQRPCAPEVRRGSLLGSQRGGHAEPFFGDAGRRVKEAFHESHS